MKEDYSNEPKSFLRHEDCPQCGSQDNVAVYWNDKLKGETKYCMTPGCNFKVTDADIRSGDVMELPEYIPLKRPIRSIDPSVWSFYNAGCASYTGSTGKIHKVLWFPYNVHFPTFTGAKLLFPFKDTKGHKVMRSIGKVTKDQLFGMQTVQHNRKTIILTEGEIDAMSAHQMTGYSAVSVPTGSKGAAATVKANLQWLERFEKVWVCFDQDEAGREASKEVMDLLKPGKGYEVLLRDGMDVNDYLTEGREEEFKRCLLEAQPRTLETLTTDEPLWDELFEYLKGENNYKSISTGIAELDGKFELRQGEVTTIMGEPSVGKSSFIRQIIANAIKQGEKVLLFSYEESYMEYVKRIACMMLDINPLFMTPRDIERVTANAKWITEHLVVCTDYFSKLDDIKNHIEYAVRSYDISMVVYDNISAGMGGLNMREEIGEFYRMLTSITKSYHIHTLIVSHIRRDKELKEGEVPSLCHAYGSGYIERLSDNVIGLARKGDSLFFGVLKQRHNGQLPIATLKFNTQTYCYTGVIEFKHEVKPDGTTKTVQRTRERKLRFQHGEGSTQPNPESPKDTKPLPTSDVRDNSPPQVQSRLSDTVQKRDSVHRSKGTIGQTDYRAIARVEFSGEKPLGFIRRRQDKALQQALQEYHRRMGETEPDRRVRFWELQERNCQEA